MNILGTGCSGLVGSRIMELLSPSYTFQNLSKETGVDITDKKSLTDYVKISDAPWVFHFAAYTDVAGAEKEKELGEQSISWNINVIATEQLVSLCKEYGKKLIYISTDYVFDGTKDWYDENDKPHPLSFYALTKYEGEERVKTLFPNALILRISTPYRSFPVGKKDFVHKIIERLDSGSIVEAPSDQIFCPTFIDDIAFSLDALIKKNASGIYHVVAKDPISPYEGALCIAKTFGFDTALVHPVSFDEYTKGKPPVPKHAYMKHGKIDNLLTLHTFEEGMQKIKKQEQKEE